MTKDKNIMVDAALLTTIHATISDVMMLVVVS